MRSGATLAQPAARGARASAWGKNACSRLFLGGGTGAFCLCPLALVLSGFFTVEIVEYG